MDGVGGEEKKGKETRTSKQKARMALGVSSWRIRMHSSYAYVSVSTSLFSVAKRARALGEDKFTVGIGKELVVIHCGFITFIYRV